MQDSSPRWFSVNLKTPRSMGVKQTVHQNNQQSHARRTIAVISEGDCHSTHTHTHFPCSRSLNDEGRLLWNYFRYCFDIKNSKIIYLLLSILLWKSKLHSNLDRRWIRSDNNKIFRKFLKVKIQNENL